MAGYKRTQEPTLRLPLSSSTNWAISSGGATLSTATTTLADGTTSATRMKVVSTSGGAIALRYSPGAAVNWFASGRTIDFDIFIETPIVSTTGLAGTFFLSNDTGFSNYFQADYLLRPGWNRVRLSRSDFSVAAGTPSFDTDMSRVQFSIAATASQVTTAYFSNLRTGGWSRPQVVIMFDDGWQSVLDTAKPLMDTYGIPGTVAVIEDFVGDAGYMSEANLQTLHAAGWGMVNHSWKHGEGASAAPWLGSSSVADCQAQISHCRAYLESLGFTRDDEHLIYCSPFGEFSTNYLTAAANDGCIFFRGTMGTNVSQLTYPNIGDEWLINPSGVLRPWPCLAGINTWTSANFITHMDRNLAAGRSTIILFHKIETVASAGLEWSTANFTALMQYLHRKRALCDFVTLPQFVRDHRNAGASA